MTKTTTALHESAPKSGLYFRPQGTITGSLLLATLGLSGHFAPAQDPVPTALPEVTVIANRTPTDLSKVGSAVSVLDAEELEKEGIYQLDDALKFVPGVVSESVGGQRGSGSSLFLRGTVTGQTHVRVDGVRITGPNISTNNFLGGSGLGGLSTIEILRGPQSALYGGDAIGGVLGLYTRKGSGDPSGRLRVEGGSFDSLSTSLELQGELDRLSYSLGAGYLTTDNDLPNNEFEQNNYTLRLDYAASADLNLGVTLRAFDSEFRLPDYSDSDFARNADDDTDSLLSTIFAELQVNDQWFSKLTLGYYDENYDSQSFDSANSYETSGTKTSVYWDNTIAWNDRHTTTTGTVFENTDYSYASVFFGLSADSNESDQYGLYLNHRWDATDDLSLTAGARWEDYDSYGDEATWRASAAYRITQTNTKLRASVGKGFRPPSFTELYGFGGGSNFDLEAEESLGWDVGFDQEFCDGDYVFSLSYFENHIKDRIDSVFDFDTFSSTYFNTPGTSLTNGIEMAASSHFFEDRLHATLSYTWLNKALSGQPTHSAGLRVHGNITDDLEAGFNIQYLDERDWGGNELDAYAVTNLHASYEINPNLSLNARVENLFDEDFEYASFGGSTWPGRGRGLFAGATFMW
jgi:vitamin B12 transporter